MKMVTGVIEPSGGVVPFDGKPILDDLMTFRQRVGYVPEEPHLYTHLSGMEYLVMIRDRALPWLPKKSYNSLDEAQKPYYCGNSHYHQRRLA